MTHLPPITLVTHTPLWVWGLLALLCYLGIRQRKTRPIQPLRSLIFPLIFLPLTLMTFKNSPDVILTTLSFAVALVLGFMLARWYFNQHPLISYDKGQWVQRGSYLPLVLYLMIFVCRYVLSASIAMHLAFTQSSGFAIVLGLPMGLGLGVLFAFYPKKSRVNTHPQRL